MSEFMEPSQQDSAIQLLKYVFGPGVVGHAIHGETADRVYNMLGAVFGAYNQGILMFGSIMLAFVAVLGIHNSANDGEILGRKWSTFWTPIRTVTGMGMLVPFASGYSTIQLFVLWVVSQSIAMTSAIWSDGVQFMFTQNISNVAAASVVDDPNFDQMALGAMRMQVCRYAVETAVNGINSGNSQPVRLRLYVTRNSSQQGSIKNYVTTYYYDDPNWGGGKEVCGTLSINNSESVDIKVPAGATVSKAIAGDFSGGSDLTLPDADTNSKATATAVRSLQNAVRTARIKAGEELFREGGTINMMALDVVRTAVTDGATPLDSKAFNDRLYQARAAATAQIQSIVDQQLSQSNRVVVSGLTEKGWIWAGSMHMEVGRLMTAVRAATRLEGSYSPGSFSLSSRLTGDSSLAADLVMTKFRSMLSELKKVMIMHRLDHGSMKPSYPELDTDFSADDFKDGGAGVGNYMKATINGWSNQLISGVMSTISDPNNGDVLLQIKDLGDYLATYGETGTALRVLGSATLKAADTAVNSFLDGSLVGKVTGAVDGNATLKFFWTILSELLKELLAYAGHAFWALTYLGYFLGIWLPMVPYYIFWLGVVGWLILVVEAVAASSLWALMFIAPTSDESFIGSQQQGFMLLMSVFFRPALMILGLVASMTMLSPLVWMFNGTFKYAFQSMQSDSVTGLLSVCGILLIYCGILLAMMMTVFSLPQTLPDRILRWVSAGTGDLGEGNASQEVRSTASGQSRAAYLAMMSPKMPSSPAAKKPDGLNAQDGGGSGSNLEGQGGQGATGSNPSKNKG